MKWAVWLPWRKFFYLEDESVKLFESEQMCRDWCRWANIACAHGVVGCMTCKLVPVPWNDQARFIANGATP